MPNHVCSKLEFNGKQEDIDRLLRHVASGVSAFDFNTLISMPKTLDIESGSRTTLGMEAAKYRAGGADSIVGSSLLWRHRENAPDLSLDQYIDSLVESGRCDLNLGEVVLDNIRDHGFATWYEWCCANWGTKWNAYSIKLTDNRLSFDTAWAAPEPVIDKLAYIFPDIQITHRWSDEDIGSNCGHVVYKNGEKTADMIVDQSDDAYEIYAFCWGESGCLKRGESNIWRKKNCSICTGCD